MSESFAQVKLQQVANQIKDGPQRKYDVMNNLLSKTDRKQQTISYNYDALYRLTSKTYPDSTAVNYTYDPLSRLTGLANTTSGSFGFGYDALGRRTSLTRPNGVNTSYSYDTLSRLLSVPHAGGALPGSTGYTYDAAGNRTSKTAVQDATPSPVSVTSNYSYDAIYELTQAVVGGTLAESYSYDAVGNRLTSAGPTSYNYNTSNELTSASTATYTYDNNGNTTSKTDSTGTTYYTWDFENRLASVTLPGTGGTVNFKYDPFGRRIEKVAPTCGTTIYAYDGDDVVEELRGGGNIVAHYTQGAGIDEPLAMTGTGGTYFYHADGLGSTTSITASTGNVGASYIYDSFGKLTASTGTITNPFQYTGREFDSETGLYYYRARYYDPGVGRFINEDPQGFSAAANFYEYVSNRATSAVDPSGLVTVIPLPAANIHTLPDIDPSCVSRINPTGVTSGGCNKVGYTVEYTGCEDCDHTSRFTITLTGSIFVAAGPFPYRGRNPADHTIVSTATALAHEQRHTDDKVNAIRPIFERAEHSYPSKDACEAAGEAAALQAVPEWERAAQRSQRRRD